MTTTPKPAKAKRPTIDLTDLTLGQLDEAAELKDKGHGRVTSYAYVGRHMIGRPDLTLEQAAALTSRDVNITESDPDADEDDDDPSSAS